MLLLAFPMLPAVRRVRRFAARRGFSLIELIFVIATIAVFGKIAATRYAASVSHYRVDAAAKRIAADLAFAQSRAMCTSKPITVVFTAASATYQMAGVTDLNSSASNYTVNLAANPYSSSIVSVTFGGAVQVTYSIYGTPSNAGTVVVSAGGFQKTITLDGVTGKTTIQ